MRIEFDFGENLLSIYNNDGEELNFIEMHMSIDDIQVNLSDSIIIGESIEVSFSKRFLGEPDQCQK